MLEGESLKRKCLTQVDKPAPLDEVNDWATRVNNFLIKNLDSSFSARFLSPPTPLPISHGSGVPPTHDGLWGAIDTRVSVLRGFIQDLRD